MEPLNDHGPQPGNNVLPTGHRVPPPRHINCHLYVWVIRRTLYHLGSTNAKVR